MDYPEWDITSAATLDNVSFKMFTEEEILKLSVKEINVAESFDMLLHPVPGGMYDPALGSTENEICCTCGQNRFQCTGHFGHIRLPLTCFNPSTFNALWNILRHSCLSCHKLAVPNKCTQILQSKLLLLETGQLVASQTVDDFNSKESNLMTWIETFPLLETTDDDKKSARHLTAARLEAIRNFMKSFKKNCPRCNKKLKLLKCISQERIISAEVFEATDNKEESAKKIPHVKPKEIPVTNICYRKSCITPVEAKQHLRKIWENDGHLLQNIYGCLNLDTLYPTDVFFLDVLPVTPSCFRPPLSRGGVKYESTRTSSYIRLLNSIGFLKDTIKLLTYYENADYSSEQMEISNLMTNNTGDNAQTRVQKLENLEQKVQEAWIKMQNLVNCLYNSKFTRSKIVFSGLKQVLEKKNGLFRKHMMGKRVNYAARSVITPDPNISISEIGVPKVFAMTLTYPQPVTPWNVHELRQMVINGPDIYPGAHSVVDQNGVKRRLYAENLTQRQSIAKQLLTPGTNNKGIITCKKVNRHMIPGDHLLVNRQPTLHKSSMQAHRARVIPNIKTFRLHYANCKAYNADFDGDEMTIHFPQSEAGRAEAMEIASAHNQYLVPKDGTPLAGLIQDHIVSGVRLTIRGRFFTRDQYHQLVYSTLVNKMDSIKIVKPSILKPRKLWSGKQVISTLLMNIIPKDKPMLTIDSTSKIAEKLWKNSATNHEVLTPELSHDMGESHVIISESELLCGVLDKGQYGATSYGLVHCCYELYGGEVSTELLTCLGRLFTNFLQMVGFTLGIKDILMVDSADKKRQAYIQRVKEFTEADVRNVLQLKSSVKEESIEKNIKDVVFAKDDRPMLELNHQIKMFTNDIQNNILKAAMPNGLLSQFPDNNLQLMVNAGAKGTSVNTMQMSCLLGQIELEGRRPPMMFSKRFLPSFTRYDISPEAGGFVTGRFLTGISPQEYFVHCMAGREGLVDTAVKTSRSGYLQRCLVKHLEGLVVGYDLTVRDSDNSVVQFYYGEDGLDVIKTKLLEAEKFPLLIQNRTAILNSDTSLPQMSEEGKEIQENILCSASEHLRKEMVKYSNTTPFLRFCRKKKNSLLLEDPVQNIPGRTQEASALNKAWFNLSERKREKYKKKMRICPDPVMSQKFPYQEKYAISEELYKAMKCYEMKLNAQVDEKHIHASQKITTDDFNDLVTCKALKSLVQPGESVGMLTSQSIGEPSTQMTLNTFHFAGYGEMNVTLGIPRLREILMNASRKIKTPTMDIPVLPSVSIERAEQLQKQLTRVTLDMVLAKVEITDKIEMQDNLHHRFYIVKFKFLPPSTYESKLPANPTKILKHMEKEYLPFLLSRLKTHINHTQDIVLRIPGKVIRQSLAKSVNQKNDGDDEQEEENGDEDNADDIDMDVGGDEDDGNDAANNKSDDDNDDVSKGKNDNKNAEDKDEDDEDDDDDIADDPATKSKKTKSDEQDYDDADESESGDDDLPDPCSDDSDVEAVEDSEEKIGTESDRPRKQKDFSSLKASKRRKMLKSFDKAIHDYVFDEDEQLWCQITFKLNVKLTKVDLLSLVKSTVTKSCIHTVPDISRSLLTHVKTQHGMECHFQTEGINIELILTYGNILDLSRLYCNNPIIMAEWFGIDAGLRIIIKEIQSVFGVYGIKVDYRHLSLVADYMTLAGKIQAFDRIHMESCASLLQQITFESASKCLNTATLNSMSDSLKSPSACIVAGQHIKSGTGSFDLRVPIKI